MPSLHFRFITGDTGELFSFSVGREGIFFFASPFEVALLWPGLQA